jgi:hypothetical protein
MAKPLTEKQIADLESECKVEVTTIDEDLTEGEVFIDFKFRDNITTPFFISEKTGKIAFKEYLNAKVYRIACRAIKEVVRHKTRYAIRPRPTYTKVSERVIKKDNG